MTDVCWDMKTRILHRVIFCFHLQDRFSFHPDPGWSTPLWTLGPIYQTMQRQSWKYQIIRYFICR